MLDADAALALLSVSTRQGSSTLRGPRAAGFELVSTGGTARALRDGGLAVTDVAAVTGFRRCSRAGSRRSTRGCMAILADRRQPQHRRQLLAAAIAPFELIVVNLYPFAAAAQRPGITLDALVEEIDIGGPSMVRAAAKNHANTTIVTAPARYAAVLDAVAADGGVPLGLRSALAIEAFAHTAAYDARIAEVLPRRMAAGVACPTSLSALRGGPIPEPAIALEKGRRSATARTSPTCARETTPGSEARRAFAPAPPLHQALS